MDTEQNDKATKSLLETIRKELNSIINDSAAEAPYSTNSTTFPSNSKPELKDKQHMKVENTSHPVRQMSNSVAPQVEDNCMDAEFAKRVAFLDVQAFKTMDEDLQKMQLELQQSYQLFQTIGDKFETINFGSLRNRIKDLHMSTEAKRDVAEKDAVADLRQLFNKSYLNNRLHKLTNEMSGKLRRHPGEFGDIPEVSAFFKACTQLQHGLQQLKRHRNEVGELSRHMCLATEASYDRIDKIRKTVANSKEMQAPCGF